MNPKNVSPKYRAWCVARLTERFNTWCVAIPDLDSYLRANLPHLLRDPEGYYHTKYQEVSK